MSLKYVALASLGLLAACTTNPAERTMTGGLGGAAAGCGIGAAIAGIPTAGIGAAPGCAIGAAIGGGTGAMGGLATTPPQPVPEPYYAAPPPPPGYYP
jgi:hypothetical protein